MADMRTIKRELQIKQEAEMRRKRKKMGRRGPSKPTRMGPIDRPNLNRLTIGQIERIKEMEKRNRRALPPQTGMLTGGQAKLDKNKNNKIDAQDFKILRAEKAKGRGQGLQDEKMKPGKVTKAALGVLAAGLSAKKKMDKKKMAPVAIGGMGASMAKLEAMKKILGRRMGGKVMKADKGKMIKKDPTAQIKNVGVKDRYGMPMKAGKELGSRAMKAAKATRMGKIAAGVAAAALAAKAGLEKMYEKRTGKKPFTKREKKRTLVDKKMGGGMMMKKPMGGGYMGGGLTEATQRLKAQGKMGGGMMMRPNPVGMKSGKSVKVKCKIGRNKPTKMY